MLHGEGIEIDGVSFFGLGAGIPVTPWDWSFDLSDAEAAELLADCPEGGVLVIHSPPQGHVDTSGAGDHLGSPALLDAIEAKQPRLAVCGHIHESWGERSRIGETEVAQPRPRRHLAGGRLTEVQDLEPGRVDRRARLAVAVGADLDRQRALGRARRPGSWRGTDLRVT